MTLPLLLGAPGLGAGLIGGIPDGIPTEVLRAASPWLLNAKGSLLLPGVGAGDVQVDGPGMVQPFPATALDLLTALGSPAGWTAADISAIHLCNTASPLVDSLGLGPNLVSVGTALTLREGIGIPDNSFVSKIAIEFPTSGVNGRFASADPTFMAPAGGTRGFLLVFRQSAPANNLDRVLTYEDVGAVGAKRWVLYWFDPGTGMELRLFVNGVIGANTVFPQDCAWHSLIGYIDDLTLTAAWESDAVASPVLGYPVGGTFDVNDFFNIGGCGAGAGPTRMQVAYLACFTKAPTSAMRQTFWRAFSPAALGTPNTYARANPLVCPISASRVACYAANQLAVGYSAGFAVDGNAGQTGVVAEDGGSFEAVGSTNLVGTGAGVNAAGVVIDGARGMRSGLRVTMAAAWVPGPAYWTAPAAGAPLAGATNVAFELSYYYRRATVGTSGRSGLLFTGDAGGPERFDFAVDPATPADFLRFTGAATPAGPAHTAAIVLLGASANLENCDFSDVALKRGAPFLAWRDVGNAAVAVTSTQTLSYTNVGNARYSPIRGAIELTISGFQGTSGATFLQYGPAAGAGSLTLDYAAGALRLRIYDSAAALAATVLCGALDATEWRLLISFDARGPVPGVLGQNITVERLNAGASPTLLGTWAGNWNPPSVDVSPLYVGSTDLGTGAARCLISLA